MSPESQKCSLRVISVNVATIDIAINPLVLPKFLGLEKILKMYFMTESLPL